MNDQFSRSKFYIQQHSGGHAGCCFCCTSTQGQTVLKVHGNLNNGASGSMKLNWWHATTSRQPRKKYLGLDIILWSVQEIYWHCIMFFASHLWLTTVYMINPIPSWREWGLALVRLNDSSVVALMNQMPMNCRRSPPITSKIGHKNMKERKYFSNQTEMKLKYFQQTIIMVMKTERWRSLSNQTVIDPIQIIYVFVTFSY